MIKRMKIFVNCLIEQCNKFSLPIELIFVEWNPIPNKPLLYQILPNASEQDYLTIRYIVVPEELHKKYKFSDTIPLYQMIAKNIGIRRAKAEFILCTNIDLLFSDEIFKLLASEKLDKHTYYRANRCDVPRNIDENQSVAKQLEFCINNTINRLGKNQLHDALLDIPAFLFRFSSLMHLYNKVLRIIFKKFNPVKYLVRSIDTVACGDFTLMHRDAWIDIQGYLEADMYSLNIDSLALFSAQALGYKQYIFPPTACIYHISHDNGWEDMNEIQRLKFTIKRPYIEYAIVHEVGISLFKKKERLNINPESWGYEDEKFKEYTFVPGKKMEEVN